MTYGYADDMALMTGGEYHKFYEIFSSLEISARKGTKFCMCAFQVTTVPSVWQEAPPAQWLKEREHDGPKTGKMAGSRRAIPSVQL